MISIEDRDLDKLIEFIKLNYGLNLTKKKSLIKGRLQNYIIQNNYIDFKDYFRYLLKDKNGVLINELINKLTTNHTYFMREMNHFTYLRDSVLPYLMNRLQNKDIRIWSAGCSSGEEAYMIAMILDEFFHGDKKGWDKKLLATDISSQVLEKAKLGIYLNEKLNVLPKSWRDKYFIQLDEYNSQVIPSIKKEIIFRRFNLMNSTFPFKKKFHVIFCRNVMIYFDLETRKRLAKTFYQNTETGGYLFIGESESLNYPDLPFKYVMPSIYRKEF